MNAHLDCQFRACAELAAIHARGTGYYSFTCHEHFEELLARPGLRISIRHDLQPDCGMPGSLWEPVTNTCFVPDSECEDLAAALEWMDTRDGRQT